MVKSWQVVINRGVARREVLSPQGSKFGGEMNILRDKFDFMFPSNFKSLNRI